MVTKLLGLLAALVRWFVRAPAVLEVVGVAGVATWAGMTWGAAAVFLVVGVAALAKSLEADMAAG